MGGGTSTMVVVNGKLIKQSLHGKLMDALAHRNPNSASSSRPPHCVLCYCGDEYEVVVYRNERNTCQRFYRCESYNENKV